MIYFHPNCRETEAILKAVCLMTGKGGSWPWCSCCHPSAASQQSEGHRVILVLSNRLRRMGTREELVLKAIFNGHHQSVDCVGLSVKALRKISYMASEHGILSYLTKVKLKKTHENERRNGVKWRRRNIRKMRRKRWK